MAVIAVAAAAAIIGDNIGYAIGANAAGASCLSARDCSNASATR